MFLSCFVWNYQGRDHQPYCLKDLIFAWKELVLVSCAKLKLEKQRFQYLGNTDISSPLQVVMETLSTG